MSDRMNLIVGRLLALVVIYFGIQWSNSRLTELDYVAGEITMNASWKDLLTDRSYCDYPQWREVAIRTGDIARCK